MIRITGGTARGAKLFSIEGRDVRPALARVRVSLFEILRDRLPGAVALDLFAGTGSLGFEALSRGAARCVFVESDPRCAEAIARSAAKLRMEDRCEVRREDAFAAPARSGGAPFDLIFVAPPYRYYVDEPERANLARLLDDLARSSRAAPGAIFAVEYRRGRGPARPIEGTRPIDRREYGTTEVTLYEKV